MFLILLQTFKIMIWKQFFTKKKHVKQSTTEKTDKSSVSYNNSNNKKVFKLPKRENFMSNTWF